MEQKVAEIAKGEQDVVRVASPCRADLKCLYIPLFRNLVTRVNRAGAQFCPGQWPRGRVDTGAGCLA